MKKFRVARYSLAVALCLSSAHALSQEPAPTTEDGRLDDGRSNDIRRGPPAVAFEVCADQAEGASCSFEGRRGDVIGICIVPPRGEEALVCAPEGGPPKEREEQ